MRFVSVNALLMAGWIVVNLGIPHAPNCFIIQYGPVPLPWGDLQSAGSIVRQRAEPDREIPLADVGQVMWSP